MIPFNTVSAILTSQVVHVTPELASYFMTLNKNIRTASDAIVAQYANDMKRGEWEINGANISFDKQGYMREGQHRMLAIIKSGITVPMVLAMGIDGYLEIDRHKLRTLGDYLHHCGVEKVALKAIAAVKILEVYDAGMPIRRISSNLVSKASRQRLIATLERNPGLLATMELAGRRAKGMGSPSLLAAAHYIATKTDAVAADSFFSSLYGGTDVSDTSPVYHLRRRLKSGTEKGSACKLNRREIMALTIKAWNLYVLGRSTRLLRWTTASEKFPEFISREELRKFRGE